MSICYGDIKIFNNEHHKIDDNNICLNASDNGICAFYFKNNASDKVEKENVINVNNWGEIYKYLMLNER